ncbi:MAG TPA: DUF1003 domain-containing protein [Thermoanaerobaculia bacterium]|nr:DUF1003 domain-containing protein [Thermoanaerobaculia bacterium]
MPSVERIVQEETARATAESAHKNIETIVRLEEEEMKQRHLGERVSDFFVRIMGSMSFVVAHLILFITWFSINLGFLGIEPFDPFPFGILTLIVSAEGVLVALFVLVSQNRMSRLANHRAHLNLQISLLAEQETTKLLQKVQSIVDRLGIETARDQELQRLSQDTHLETLARELQEKLPAE